MRRWLPLSLTAAALCGCAQGDLRQRIRETAILPDGWLGRLIRITSPNTGGATGFCLDVHDLVLSKYAASREKDIAFNQALIRHGCVAKRKLLALLKSMPVDDQMRGIIQDRIKVDFAVANPGRRRKAGQAPKP